MFLPRSLVDSEKYKLINHVPGMDLSTESAVRSLVPFFKLVYNMKVTELK